MNPNIPARYLGLPVLRSWYCPRGQYLVVGPKGRPETLFVHPWTYERLLAEVAWQALLAKHRRCCGTGVHA